VRIDHVSAAIGSERMASRVYRMLLGIGAVGILVGALVFGLRPQAQEAEEGDVEEVTAPELELYIDVYTAMQADHDLTLDVVLQQKGTSLSDFRNIERRVQKQERLVRKVRDALQAQAKVRAESIGPPAARAEAPAPKAP
jgi:hypothetical protein